MQDIVYHTNFEIESDYWWFVARNKIVKKFAEKFSSLQKGDYVLDVGCGTGGFAELFAKDFNVLCLDTSPIALEYCRKRGLRNLFHTTIEEFPKGKFKIKTIFMLDVIEHIENDINVLKSAYDLLEAGGTLMITVPAYRWLWSRHDEIHMHKRRYTRNQIYELLKLAGFQVKFLSYFNFFLFFPAVIKRVLIKKKEENIEPVEPVSNFMNKILLNVFLAEKFFLSFFRFPFGLSILAVAQKGN